MGDEPRDVNEKVIEEWVEETTPEERVQSVMKRMYEACSVEEVAERARVDVSITRAHLQNLTKVGFVEQTADAERSGACYKRAPESIAKENKLVNSLAGVEEFRDRLDYRDGWAYCPRRDCDWCVPRGMEYAYRAHEEEHEDDE